MRNKYIVKVSKICFKNGVEKKLGDVVELEDKDAKNLGKALEKIEIKKRDK